MSEENEKQFIRRFCANDEIYEKGQALRDGSDVLNLDRTVSARSKRIYISGSVRDGQNIYGPWLIFDPAAGELTSYFCQCGSCGTRYGGMCVHCAALMIEYCARYPLAGEKPEAVPEQIPGMEELLDSLPERDYRRKSAGTEPGKQGSGEGFGKEYRIPEEEESADDRRTRYQSLEDPYGGAVYEPEEIDRLLENSMRQPAGNSRGGEGVSGSDGVGRPGSADGGAGTNRTGRYFAGTRSDSPSYGGPDRTGTSLTDEGFQSFRGFDGTIGEWLESVGRTAWGAGAEGAGRGIPTYGQKTDSCLQGIIRGYAAKNRLSEQEACGVMDLEPVLEEGRSRFGYYYADSTPRMKLTFRISNDSGRSYQVKNIVAFADAIREEQLYTHGKFISFVHSKSMFTERGWKYCEMILAESSRSRGTAYAKEMPVYPDTLDRLMEINLNGSFYWYNEGNVEVRDENPPIRVLLRKSEGEYTVEFGKLRVLEGEKYSYVLTDGVCYRPKREFLNNMKEWLETLAETSVRIFDIAEADMPDFFAAVVPVLQKYDLVEFEGFEPEEFMPKKPVFSFYIDEENDVVQAKCYVAYGEQSCNLLHEEAENIRSGRDTAKERRIRALLEVYFPQIDAAGSAFCFDSEDDERMYRLLTVGLSQLAAEGKVYVTDRIRAHRIITNPRAQVGISVAGGLLELSVATEEFPREELAGVIESYRQKKKYHRLRDGSFLNIEDNAVSGIAELMDGMSLTDRQISADRVEVPKYWAAYLDQSLKQGSGQLRVDRGRDYKAIIRQMNNIADSDYVVPASLAGTLRGYQKTGYRWMRVLTELGFGGILADDMGLGKTLQTITCLLARKQEGGLHKPCLIVCPASLIYNWQREFERFAPEMSVQIIAGSAAERARLIHASNCLEGRTGTEGEPLKESRSDSDRDISQKEQAVENKDVSYNGSLSDKTLQVGGLSDEPLSDRPISDRLRIPDVWITSYDMLKRDIEEYQSVSFDTEVIDESQNIKNQNTLAAKAVKQIRADTRFALTGTPIENRLSELWSCFDYLMPGILGTYGKFRKKFEIPIVQNQDESTLTRLKRMVSPFILRRLKQDVLKELPDKLEQVVYAKMEGEQRRLYVAHATRLSDSIRMKNADSFREDQIAILAEMTKLRQICCDPSLLFEDYHDASCKMDTCMELVREAVEGKHKVLIFSQFTSLFPLLEERLRQEEIAWYELTGRTPKKERQRLTDAFNNDDVPVFLISLKAGGTGLNLTAATIVIHFDPWWNLAAQNQATDRAHRIGQENQVVVFKLIAQDTIEEKILNLQEKKGMLAEQVLEGGQSGPGTLTREDLMEILEFAG